MTGVRLGRILWIGTAAILILGALVALSAVFGGDFSETDGQILLSLAALLLAGGTFVSGLALVDREGALLGRLAALLAPVGFALVVYAIWEMFDDSGDEWRYGWTGVLLLIALLLAVTARLLARGPSIKGLAMLAGALGGAAAAVSSYAVWNHESDGIGQALAALWIVAVLCYLLVPVLQRFAAAGAPRQEGARVLAELDGVELVTTRDGPGIDVRLEPGERLVLRRRA